MLGRATLVAETHMISGAGCVKKREKTGSYGYKEREATWVWIVASLLSKKKKTWHCCSC